MRVPLSGYAGGAETGTALKPETYDGGWVLCPICMLGSQDEGIGRQGAGVQDRGRGWSGCSWALALLLRSALPVRTSTGLSRDPAQATTAAAGCSYFL